MLNSQGTVLVINDSFVSLTRRGFKYHSLFSAFPHGEAGRGTDAVRPLLLATSHWGLSARLQETQVSKPHVTFSAALQDQTCRPEKEHPCSGSGLPGRVWLQWHSSHKPRLSSTQNKLLRYSDLAAN